MVVDLRCCAPHPFMPLLSPGFFTSLFLIRLFIRRDHAGRPVSRIIGCRACIGRRFGGQSHESKNDGLFALCIDGFGLFLAKRAGKVEFQKSCAI